MLYTIAGAIIGGVATLVYCRMTRVSAQGGQFGIPSDEAFLVALGVVVGGGVGFGYGVHALSNGNHIVQKAAHKMFH